MPEKPSGRDAETQRAADQRDDQPTKQSGSELAHGQPPNPEPAAGPRDPEFTQNTVPDSSPDDPKRRAG